MPQKITSWSKDVVLKSTQTIKSEQFNSTSNTTITAGKQDLRAQNAYSKLHRRLVRVHKMEVGNLGAWFNPVQPDAAFDYGGRDFTTADNIAYGKFKGRLHYGGASLGVTIGEWRSSSEMIFKRSIGLYQALNRSLNQISRDNKLRKQIKKRGILARDILSSWNEDGSITRKVHLRVDPRRRSFLADQNRTNFELPLGGYVSKAADNHLEYIFGWVPLVKDLKAAFTTLAKEGIPPMWVIARGSSTSLLYGNNNGSYSKDYWTILQSLKTTYCVNVEIANPNVWLANRAGLLNVAAVAWDLVPWSFVVGMFVNVNTMLSAMTDTVGLTLTNQSITRTVLSYQDRVMTHGDYSKGPNQLYPGSPGDAGYGGFTHLTWSERKKNRTLNTPLKPTMVVRVPELKLETLVMASALVVQRMAKISKLFT